MKNGFKFIINTRDFSLFIPVFKGEGYEHQSYRMKNFFRSQNLWKIIEEGVNKEGPEAKKMENEKK